jgi:mRNA-degrading endonuclease HigB of HigAB toxin-antitoxin module
MRFRMSSLLGLGGDLKQVGFLGSWSNRLITVIHYAKTTEERRTDGHIYIRSFLSHKEYDNPSNWDRKFGTK